MKIEKTNVMRILDSNNIKYKVYDYRNTNAVSGIEVAESLHEDPKKVFKTLVTIGKSKNHYVFLVPVDKELDLKKCAKAVNEKNIEMIKSKELLPLTGYIHGGCSPIGMRHKYKVVIDSSCNNYDTIMFSGGKIGYQVEVSLKDLKQLINYETQDIKED